MRIIYVAKHDSGGNDDEGAVYHALLELGHDVQRVREIVGKKAYRLRGDMLLFHKWDDLQSIEKFAGFMPRVFWYFDLVQFPDPSLRTRCAARAFWMQRMLQVVELGFCTDGDWAASNPKLVWLPQGADSRVTGYGDPSMKCTTCGGRWIGPPVLFTGTKRGGEGRNSFVDEVQARWGKLFRHILGGIHGRSMANLIAGSKIVLAPDAPITDRYWSNRVYNTLGFGGFMLHPYCAELIRQYAPDELVTYRTRAELHELIGHYLKDDYARRAIMEAGYLRTMAQHTYRHRCEQLIAVAKERLGI